MTTFELPFTKSYAAIRKDNGLRGRQQITDCWSYGNDDVAFDSNARGDSGETLTFHYTAEELFTVLYGTETRAAFPGPVSFSFSGVNLKFTID